VDESDGLDYVTTPDLAVQTQEGPNRMTTQEQNEKDRLAEIENRKVYERHLAWVRATYPEDYERYLEAVKTAYDPYAWDDQMLDETAEAFRSAPVHPPRPRGAPAPAPPPPPPPQP
jgi:hypothetical protein